MIKKILIIDDSVTARFFIKSCIHDDTEYEIFEAGDGKQGVDIFKQIQPDLTFLDLTMPEMNGFEALNEIKSTNKDAVVVILTADIQKKTFERVTKLGALMLIKKPPTKESIHDALSKAQRQLEDIRQSK
ncbi:MAG: response regulator [Nitrospirae bacterium]|nr:response regulator [Nitrospirota bacterium]